jgi:hypothetical protein
VFAVALGAAAAAYAFDARVVSSEYAVWRNLPEGFTLDPSAPATGGTPESSGISLEIVLAGVGALIGAWLGRPAQRSITGKPGLDEGLLAAAQIGSGAVAGAFLGAGHLWGATLAGSVLLLLRKEPFLDFVLARWKPLAIFAVAGAAWSLYAVATLGLREGISRVATYPFPYMAFFFSQFPGLVALFAATALWMILSSNRTASPGLLAVVLGVLMPMTAMGLVSAWGGTRYLFQLYPYMILAASAFLVFVLDRVAGRVWASQRQVIAPLGAVLVVLAGATGGHGIQSAVQVATLEHGEPINEYTHAFPFRPDHRGPGLYVRGELQPGDLVIAEDPAIQFVYAGKVDYWFRREGDARAYLHLDEAGTPREMYATAIPLVTPEAVDSVVSDAPGRVWLITSGETAPLRDWFLSVPQLQWLESIEEGIEPSFVGEDGHSRVFCLNC